MATHLRDNTTVYNLADICDSITGALETDPKTAALATTWAVFTSRADKLGENQKALTRKLSRVRSRLEVQDAIWDPEMAAFGRAVVDASHGKRDIPPYTRFFKDTPPSEAQKLVPGREVEFANACLTELNRNPQEALAVSWAHRLKVVTDALSLVVVARTGADKEQHTENTSLHLLIGEVNLALDVLEGDLQKIFPGDAKRVASYLSSTKPTASGSKPSENKATKDESTPASEGK
jgi:hypothetical protein